MTLTKHEIEQFQSVSKLRYGTDIPESVLKRAGASAEKLDRYKKEIDNYLNTIEEPTCRDAMKTVLYTGTDPGIAAAIAVKHEGIDDRDGKLASAITRFVEIEMNKFR